MSVKVIDHSVSFESKTEQKANIFLRLLADEVVQISEPNTPKRDNFLRKDVLKQVLGLRGKIVWAKTYAAVQEAGGTSAGIRFRNYTTPGTGPHYARNAVNEAVAKASTIMRRAGMV